jgi:ubiquinone/menaquinone biosynthesis C-methylase UbiE
LLRKNGCLSILHLAPEDCLESALKRLPQVTYVSCDLRMRAADVCGDATALPFADERFDLIMCVHVLEHIPDDHRAMQELRRVLRPGGTALLISPVDNRLESTFEDPDASSPQQRMELFHHPEHVRIYGRDYEERIKRAGYDAVTVRFLDELSEAEKRKHGLTLDEVLHIGIKPAA